jgi:L-xylulokinase
MIAEEPETVRASRWALSCKDYLTMRLTGIAGTDFTEASESFTDKDSQDYDDRILGLYGLQSIARLRAPISAPDEVVGTVTPAAGSITGLPSGVAVVAGVHDVDASAMGSGAIRSGQLVMVAGSYSINEVFVDRPVIDDRWFARSAPVAGRWLNMAISPTSTSTLEWFLGAYGLQPDENDRREGRTVYDLVRRSYEAVRGDRFAPLFVPHVYGSPTDFRSDGAFVDLRARHGRDHLVHAVLEGIVFTHRHHVEALRSRLDVSEIRLTGGAARASYWAQLFADALGSPVQSVQTPETGALGAALCALSGAGVFAGLDEAVASLEVDLVRHDPDALRVEIVGERYERFEEFNRALDSVGRSSERKRGDDRG